MAERESERKVRKMKSGMECKRQERHKYELIDNASARARDVNVKSTCKQLNDRIKRLTTNERDDLRDPSPPCPCQAMNETSMWEIWEVTSHPPFSPQ